MILKLIVFLTLILPDIHAGAEELSPVKGKTKKVIIDEGKGEESWYFIQKNLPLTFILKGQGTLEIQVRSLVANVEEKSPSFIIEIKIDDSSSQHEIPSLSHSKNIRAKGLEKSLPTQTYALPRTKIKTGEGSLLLNSSRNALVRVLWAPQKAEKVTEIPSFPQRSYSFSFLAGPLYYLSSFNFYNPGVQLRVNGAFDILPGLRLRGKIDYMFYRAGYLYADSSNKAIQGLDFSGFYLNESRIKVGASVFYLLFSSNSLELRAGGGYSGSFFMNSAFNYNYQAIDGEGELQLKTKKGKILTGASISMLLGGTGYLPTIEGRPSGYALEIPLTYSFPLKNLDLSFGYSFEMLNYEQGRRFYNTFCLSLTI